MDTLGHTRDWTFGILLIPCDQSGVGPVRRELNYALRW